MQHKQVAYCAIAVIPRQHRFVHACTHTHTQNMDLSVPGNKESNHKITKYSKGTVENVKNVTVIFGI